MASVLVLTTDLPYFPGKMGLDFFNLRHLARRHRVGVVGPLYDSFPREGVANLEAILYQSFFWPRPVEAAQVFVAGEPGGRLPGWVCRLPARIRRNLHRRLLGLQDRPAESFNALAILSNCAPQLLRAITSHPWHAIVLIQTNIEPWLDYLPPLARFVYFHDVRSDYLARCGAFAGSGAPSATEAKAIRRQEQAVTERVEVVGFVSALDQSRASSMFRMKAECGVVPIAVDTDYYHPAPEGWKRDPRPVVLFTGHLSHPPNVDAVRHFLRDIWPTVLDKVPDAIFQVVGMLPHPELASEVTGTAACELHPNVPDVRPYFWNASAYVVPMRFGGGVRQKLFEAWSMRLPVVCTTMAAEGTEAADGRQLWMCDEPRAFAEQVAQVLRGSVDCGALVEAASEEAKRNHSIDTAAPRFEALVERAIQIRRSRPYKLLYDLRWMEIGRAGGMEQATYELISAIAELDRQNEYRVYAPRSTCCEWNFPATFRVRTHPSDQVERDGEALRSFVTNRLGETLGAPPILTPTMRSLAAFSRMDFDFVHSVAGYTHPDLLGHPGVLTINDLQHLHYPEFFTKEEWEERERLYRSSAEKAQHIICISEHTRQDVHRQYGVPLEKLTTVWIIPSRNVWREIAPGLQRDLLRALGLDGRLFFFFPAHCWPHKNHARLVQAFARIRGELPANFRLVLTGRSFPSDHPAAILIRDLQLQSQVDLLGYRSPLEIRALFRGCSGLVFPSLFEGYGMPVAEAIIAGRPVACSNTTSLPEIAGEAALTFDPADVDDIAAKLLELATDGECRASLEHAALRRRALFSAHRRAVETLAIYRKVYAELCGS